MDGAKSPLLRTGTSPAWAEHLEFERAKQFVGRVAEQALWTEQLGAREKPHLTWIHGVGGVGKTSLLRRFERLVREHGAEPIWLDVRSLHGSEKGLPLAVAERIEVLQQATPAPRRLALLFDTGEAWSGLDYWLRESFLPGLAECHLVAVASRRPPASEWLHDPAWASILTPLPLGNLSLDESKALLASRGVADDEQERPLFESGGHPLALSLFADVVRQRRSAAQEALVDAPHVVSALLERFVHDAPDEDCRSALYACAHARVIDEGALRLLFVGPDVGERARRTYDWLRSLSFVHEGTEGLSIHELAAVALDTELRTRDRIRYRALHVTLRESLITELHAARPQERARIACDLVWLHRFGPVVRPWTDWEASRSYFPGPLRASDHRDIIENTRRFEGDASARAVEGWLSLQPEAFTVVRSSRGEGVGYVMHPKLSREEARVCDHDPFMRAAAAHAAAVAPPREDESIAVVNWRAYQTYGEPHPGFVAGSLQIVLFFLGTPRLSWSCIPIVQRELWLPLMLQIGHQPGPELALDGRSFLLCMHDWRRTTTSTWFDGLAQDEPPVPAERYDVGAQALHTLSREAFTQALRSALQVWESPTRLARSPLMQLRSVRSEAHDRAPVERFRALVEATLAAMKGVTRQASYAAALEVTYLRPAPSQERAAERLGLAFSTYRRHLGKGLDVLAQTLWERELDGA
jgi:hypothetical protein